MTARNLAGEALYGTYAVVGCGGGLIKAYDYDTGWVTIGSGYSTQFQAGFRWWQIDMTFYTLRVLSWIGIVRGLRPVPAPIIEEARAAGERCLWREKPFHPPCFTCSSIREDGDGVARAGHTQSRDRI